MLLPVSKLLDYSPVSNQIECPDCGSEFPDDLRECPECWFTEEPLRVRRMRDSD
ncbi:hypothetical protein UFOVP587_22 [uncultured Caudovirales phage]|uniref:Uncharacterized protein n=1 Tax=uncultured Caudovirales phage TaxID=2100421 RepID=A0A6J5N2N1_9CAUD|nr:hypothetical protein UFOVP587_22 [uncultured Caudovirales phage]